MLPQGSKVEARNFLCWFGRSVHGQKPKKNRWLFTRSLSTQFKQIKTLLSNCVSPFGWTANVNHHEQRGVETIETIYIYINLVQQFKSCLFQTKEQPQKLPFWRFERWSFQSLWTSYSAGSYGPMDPLMIWQIKWPKCLELDAQDKAQKGSNRLWQSVILHILLQKTARKRKTLFLPNGSII